MSATQVCREGDEDGDSDGDRLMERRLQANTQRGDKHTKRWREAQRRNRDGDRERGEKELGFVELE